jgi:hypothetical protein
MRLKWDIEIEAVEGFRVLPGFKSRLRSQDDDEEQFTDLSGSTITDKHELEGWRSSCSSHRAYVCVCS